MLSIVIFLTDLIHLFVSFVLSVFGACQCRPAMAEQDPQAAKPLAASHFIIGSVSEDNSEDETLGKSELSAEDKEHSASPSSLSSDSTFECLDGPLHNMRSASYSALAASRMCVFMASSLSLDV